MHIFHDTQKIGSSCHGGGMVVYGVYVFTVYKFNRWSVMPQNLITVTVTGEGKWGAEGRQ